MSQTLIRVSCALVFIVCGASVASAHRLTGKIYCDANPNGKIDSGDTKLDGVVVKATSLTASPGQMFFDTSGDAEPTGNVVAGFYRIEPHDLTDDYRVELTGEGVPAGSTVILPTEKFYLVSLVAGSPETSRRDGLHFLLDNCGGAPTTTSTSVTSTSLTSTSSPSTSATSTSSSSSSSAPSSSITSTTAPISIPSTTATSTSSTTTTTTPHASTTSTTPQVTTTSTPSSSVSTTSSSSTTTTTPQASTTSTTPQVTTTSTPSSSVSTTSSSSTTTSSTVSSSSTTSSTVPHECPLLDHFKCYKTRRIGFDRFDRREVMLADQFETKQTRIMRPSRLCNPVDKNGEGIDDPTAHLSCYDARDADGTTPFTTRDVVVENQFGTLNLKVTQLRSLCLPASKDMVPLETPLHLDHFKCYQVRRRIGEQEFQPREVTLVDQFETKVTTVLKPWVLCNPVDKEGEGILQPACHLLCYKIKDQDGQAPFESRKVMIEDQFSSHNATAFRGSCRKISTLCVPSMKTSQ